MRVARHVLISMSKIGSAKNAIIKFLVLDAYLIHLKERYKHS
jgi:hypothetical protein